MSSVVLMFLFVMRFCTTSQESLRPISERTCLPSFVCIHGYCDMTNTISCVCDPGWKQPFCDISECGEICTNGTKCALDGGKYKCVPQTIHSTLSFSTDVQSSTVEANVRYCFNNAACEHGYCDTTDSRCVCENNWTGDLCQLPCPFACFTPTVCVHRNGSYFCEVGASETSPIVTTDVTIPTKPSEINQARNACSSEYEMRTKDERTCLNSFQCEYGLCKFTNGEREIRLECICDHGGIGEMCEKVCCLDCGINGVCQVNGTGYEYCSCRHNYRGKYCEDVLLEYIEDPEKITWTWWVVGGSLFVVFSLFVIVGIVVHCMWQHRVLMIMKIVHRFQPFEDSDTKEFDAFVSYRSSEIDEHFVYNNLYPKLEKEMGFKLCLHYRDFIPGDTIANNIIWAINNSRRTIIVLSSQYIRSDFTRFEYQVAQTEMLKRKHRIIPILIEDIKPLEHEMEDNLKLIIESVTYLKWPGENAAKSTDHFWNQLLLSLPKKRTPSPGSQISISKLGSDSYDNNSSSYNQENQSLESNKYSSSFHSFCDGSSEINQNRIEVSL